MTLKTLFVGLTCLILGACRSEPTQPSADLVIVGENIISMEADAEEISGVAIRGEDIVHVGTADSVASMIGPDTRVIKLGSRTLIPGLIDSHGHFTATARLNDFVNLSSPPVGTAESIDDIVDLLSDRILVEEVPVGEWVVGYGYDDSLLAENQHPTRDDLDRVSTEHPIVLLHVSGHLSAANSLALQLSEITADTKDPKGGVIRRRAGSREPNGVLEETASSRVVYARIGAIEEQRFVELLRETATAYAGNGITTAQDGAISLPDLALMREMATAEPFAIDIGTYPFVTMLDDDRFAALTPDQEYQGGIRLVGVKFSLDGSPQGRTAWLTEPYTEGPPGADSDYVAYGTMEPSLYMEKVSALINRSVPVLVHANGDAAMDLMLDGIDAAIQESPTTDHRSVIIHAQLMREDQVKRAAELNVIPSYFSAHTFFWGDWHRKSFGDDRAQNISPTRWARDYGVQFTVHNDAPVVPPDMMRLLWATVNRETRSGHIIGPEQRLSVIEALHALTLGGAYQFFEEDRKGSIREGKQADLVILDANPLSVDVGDLKDLQVIETFSRGRSVYRKKGESK